MTNLFTLANGNIVDITTATIEFVPMHSSEKKEMRGLKTDMIMGQLFMDAVRADGSRWKAVVKMTTFPAKTEKQTTDAKRCLKIILEGEVGAMARTLNH